MKSESGVDNADSSKNWQRNNTTESPNTCTALPIALPATGSATPTITVTLDSITDAGGHFAQLFATVTDDAKLIPGENFTLYVRGGEGVWEEAQNLKREEEEAAADKFGVFNPYAKVDNSLFAFAFTKAKGGAYVNTAAASNIFNSMGTANINNLRHLQNLDFTVSAVGDGVTAAKLLKDLNWNTEKTFYMKDDQLIITNAAGKTVTDTFCGIYTKALTEFDGNNKTITDLVVDGSKMGSDFTDKGLYSAGLFRYVESGLTVKNLHLEKPIITAGSKDTTKGNAGAIAGEVATGASLTIDTVIAEPGQPDDPETPIPAAQMTVSASDGAAGGLVGLGKGTLNINNSAAVLLVNGGIAAGGLVGSSESSVTLSSSYVGGHTLNGAYSDSEWNVTSSGAAGGLIGQMVGEASIAHTFSTASVKGGAGSAGGLVGIVNISSPGKLALDYAYTVAPVEGVEALGESGSNGALIGFTNSDIANGDVFFLPDVYEDPLTESGTNNVTLIGTSGKNFTATSKVHVADVFNKSEPTIVGLTGTNSELEMHTTTYDSTLDGKEYPFKISTSFNGDRHFYGDWAPPKNSESSQFTIHFLIQTLEQDGESNPPVDFIMDTGVAGAAISSTTIYAQLDPFDGAQVTVPTMPYKPGYNYGTNEGILSLANVYSDSHPLSKDAPCVWQVYIGDQTSTLKGGGTVSSGETGARYSRNGGTIELTEEDLRAALPSGATSGELTLVASYYKLKDQYSFTLMDYDPKTVEGLPDESKYGQWGNLQFVNEPGFNGTESGIDLCYKTVYKYENNTAFDPDYGNLIIPKLNVKGYTFLGWYDGTGSDAAQVFSCVNGVLKLETPNTEIKNNVKLYARYRQNEQSEITLSFVLEQDTQSIPLSIEYTLEFDKSLGFDQDIDLPGFEKGVNGLKVVSYASATDTEGTVVLDVNGTPATSSVAWFNRLKVKETVDGQEVEVVKDTDRSVHINTGVRESYPYKYTVYYHGNVDMVGVVVMHELDHTSYYNNAANPTYTYDTGTYYEKYAETLVIEGTQPPIESSYYPVHPLDKETLIGFKQPGPEQIFAYPYNAKNAAKYGVSESSVSGKNIAWIIVVPYAREQYEMRFVNLGMSQGEDKFQWKMPYVGESLAAYLPATSDYSPQLYGENYKFKRWQYEYPDGTVINQAPTTMPDHDLVLRAQYEGQPVDYTVLIWVENPDPDKNADGTVITNADGTPKYSYTQVGRKVITGGAYPGETIQVRLVGGEVNVKTDRIAAQPIGIAGIVDKTVGDKTVRLSPYIEYSHSDENVTADGKGTTKFNVYYDRKVYRLRFDVGYSEPVPGTTSTTYEPIENYEGGDVYGKVGNNYYKLIKNGEEWLRENSEGDDYGWDDASGLYVKLTSETNPVTYYRAEYRYTTTTSNTPEEQYGIAAVNGENYYVLLTRTSKTVYNYTEETSYRRSDRTYYGEKDGEYKLLSGPVRTDYPASVQYTRSNGTVVTVTNGTTRYNTTTDRNGTQYGVVNKTLVRVTRSGNTWYNGSTVYSGTRYKTNNSGSYVFDTTDGAMYAVTSTSAYYIFQWSMDGEVYGETKSSNTTLDRNDKNLDTNAFYTRDNGTTSYAWSYNDEPYDGTRYTRQSNGYDDEYLRSQLVERGDSLYYLDTDGRYGAQNVLVAAVWKRDTTKTTYYLNSVEYKGTLYQFSEYIGDLYKQVQTGTNKYYVSTIKSKTNYNDYLTTHVNANSAGSNTTNPFTYRTSKTFVKDSYNGTRTELKNGTTYTIYYWDIVAKYGSNIKDMWPTTFSDQSSNGFIGWIIQSGANESSGSIKDAREIMTEKLFVGTGTAQTKDENGIYVGEPSQVFKGRYSTVGRHFVSRYYFKDPDTNQYPAVPKYEYVYNSEAGNPAEQKVGDVDGYAQQDYDLLDSSGRVMSSKTWSQYTVTLMLPPKTSVDKAMVFKYYFDPIPYDINFEYVGDLSGTITRLGSSGKVEDVPFGRHIGSNDAGMESYAYETIPGLDLNEYTWDGNWYDNEACLGEPFFKAGDADYNSTRTMPNGELTLYAKVIHKPVTVTLELGTPDEGETITMSGNSVNSLAWQDPVSSLLLEDNGSFKEAFTPVRTAPQNAVYHWNFLGWTTKQTGATKDDEYVYAQPQMTSITLYPIWEQADNAKAATVHIVYQYYDDEVKDYVTIPNLPASVKTEYTHHPNNPDKEIVVGDYFSLVAPNLEEYGYTAIDASVGPLQVNEESITIPIKYRQTAWFITVNYYVQFTSVTPEGWMTTDTDEHITAGSSPKTATPVTTATVAANSEYFLMGYTAPDVDWLKDYRFDHFEFGDYTTYSNYVTVHPDATTNKATVDVYLTPDTDNIMIPDLVCPYIGKSYANYSKGNPIKVDSSVGNCEIHYVFYDADGKKLTDAEVVNAGAYGMRAYITVKTGGSTYLIWQSVGDDPPLHLYIQRRVVILYSAIATDTYGDDKVLEAPTVYYRPCTPAMLASGNEAMSKIERYYKPEDPHYLGLQDYESDNNPGNAGFVNGDDQYFEWEFSASAFRREKGISYNIFTYKVTAAGKELDMEDNYYFYVCFGTLTVTD